MTNRISRLFDVVNSIMLLIVNSVSGKILVCLMWVVVFFCSVSEFGIVVAWLANVDRLLLIDCLVNSSMLISVSASRMI